MSFKEAVIRLATDLSGVFSENAICEAVDFISNNDDAFQNAPTNNDDNSSHIIAMLCRLIIAAVEIHYGDTDTEFEAGAIINYDLLLEYPSMSQHEINKLLPSRIAVFTNDSKYAGRFGIAISVNCRCWEDVFYDMCHECLHLLNPTNDISKKKIQRLEEGVAVKFAENMFNKYIKPYYLKHPINSPLSLPLVTLSARERLSQEQYFESYRIAMIIPDDNLKLVREKFGSFWSVKDEPSFVEAIGNCLTSEEVNYILDDFDYSINLAI